MPDISKGDLVRIAFTGRLASNNSVFETTDEATAKSGQIWSSTTSYGPRLVIFGTGNMISGLEENISSMQIGQKKNFHIPQDKAFGPRFKELVRIMPEKEFARHNVLPAANLVVTIDGLPAVVKSITSGRVMLDFNHPLAGEELEYELELLEIITEPKEKAGALAKTFGTEAKISEEGGKLKIEIPSGLVPANARALLQALRSSLGERAEIIVPGA